MGMIWVKAHPKSGDRVAIWEVDDRHPKNSAGEPEIFVAGQDQEPQEVFETAQVQQRIKDERLIKVDAPAAPAKKGAKPAAGPSPEELAAAEAARLEAEAAAAAEAAKKGGN